MDHQGVSSLKREGWDHHEMDEPWMRGGKMEMELCHLPIGEYPR